MHEVQLHGIGERPNRLAAAEQLGDGGSALLAVVLRQLVDVHLDEAVGDRLVDAAAELERVLERLVAVLEPAVDRLGEHLGEVVDAVDVAARDVDAERQRQPRLEQPPLAEVEHLVQADVGERQLALVDQQAVVGPAGRDLVRDLLERQLAVGKVAEHEPERQECGRHRARHDDLLAAQVVDGRGLAADDDRAVAGADARAVGEQRVVLLHERVGGERDRGDLEARGARPLVERLDIRQNLLERESARIDEIRRQRPEHEGVIGIGAVADANLHWGDDGSTLPAAARGRTGAPVASVTARAAAIG